MDDHKPYFKRSIDEPPMTVKVVEESASGTEVGFLQALDDDVGDNAKIDYIISCRYLSNHARKVAKHVLSFLNNLYKL